MIKKSKKIFKIAPVLALVLVVVIVAIPRPARAGYSETYPATGITNTSATLNGGFVNYSSAGWAGFVYSQYTGTGPCGISSGYATVYSSTSVFYTTTPFPYSTTLTNYFTPGTVYYFCAVSQDGLSGAPLTYGSMVSFRTLGPAATTGSATNIDATTATLNGSVNPNGLSTNAWFEWGDTLAYGTDNFATPQVLSGSTNVALTPLNITGLTPTWHHFRVVASNSEGTTYGNDVAFTPYTNIADGVNPGNATVAPESGIIDLDSFTLVTSMGTDNVTAPTVTLAAGTNVGLSEVRITDSTGAITYYSAANPASNIINFSSGIAIPVSTTPTTYKIRITPKTHLNMPAPSGASYATTGTVTAFTSTKPNFGTDTASATITIDNLSPAGTVGASATPGDTQATVSWTNPGDLDFQKVIIYCKTASITEIPTEGSNPSVDINPCDGTARVKYSGSTSPQTITGLTNGMPYYFRIFARDTNGNFTAIASTQQVSATPAATTYGISVTVSGSGTGSISSSPTGIASCSSTGGTCTASFSNGTTVTLTATVSGSSTFGGFSGCTSTGTYTCTVNSAATVTANFTAPAPVLYGVEKLGASDFWKWAWGGDVMGWISFNSLNTGAANPYRVYVLGTLPCSAPTATFPPTAAYPNLHSIIFDRCDIVNALNPTFTFIYNDTNGYDLVKYTLMVYDSANSLVDTISDITPPTTHPGEPVSFNYSGPLVHTTLNYNTTYYFKVIVQNACNLN